MIKADEIADTLRDIADQLDEIGGGEFLPDISLAHDRPGRLIAFNEGCTRELHMSLGRAVVEEIRQMRDADDGSSVETLEIWARHFERLAKLINREIVPYQELLDDTNDQT